MNILRPLMSPTFSDDQVQSIAPLGLAIDGHAWVHILNTD